MTMSPLWIGRMQNSSRVLSTRQHLTCGLVGHAATCDSIISMVQGWQAGNGPDLRLLENTAQSQWARCRLQVTTKQAQLSLLSCVLMAGHSEDLFRQHRRLRQVRHVHGSHTV